MFWLNAYAPMWERAPFIFDCKLTKDLHLTFGDFAWGHFNEAIDAERESTSAGKRKMGWIFFRHILFISHGKEDRRSIQLCLFGIRLQESS